MTFVYYTNYYILLDHIKYKSLYTIILEHKPQSLTRLHTPQSEGPESRDTACPRTLLT